MPLLRIIVFKYDNIKSQYVNRIIGCCVYDEMLPIDVPEHVCVGLQNALQNAHKIIDDKM